MISEYEEEIKIEYFDTRSPDPLSENCNCNSKENVIINDYEKNIDNIEREPTITNKNILNTDPKSESVNWFRNIDCDGRYLCRYCNSKYSTVQTLRYHVKSKHLIEAQTLEDIILKNKRKHKFKCHVCKDKFQCLNDLETHFKAMHGVVCLQQSCLECDATFVSDNDLTLHQINVHSNIKKPTFVCLKCGYRTSKKSHYKQHQNTHQSVKNHKCKFCDYITNYLPNMKIHERIHTKHKPYKCDFKNCMYVSAAKSALRSHQLKHFPYKNMLYCDKCCYKTVYKQTLKKHQASHDRNTIGLRIV